MLILSRRKAEKVLFPSLGITIEVTRIQGRTVQLGIDAPEEIRIIREELQMTADPEIDSSDFSNKPQTHDWHAPQDIQKCLNAANLAIHLAQNQLKQQLNDNAEVALERALECLEQLELAVVQNEALATAATAATAVHESKTGYRRAHPKVALLVDESQQLGAKLNLRLKEFGYSTRQLDSGEALIQFLQTHEQPSLVVTRQPLDDSVEIPPGLRVFGIGSLQKSSRCFELDDSRFTGWFAEPDDAEAIASCFA